MLIRDALMLLKEANTELKAHEADYHHTTRKGLIDEIDKLLFDFKTCASVIVKKDRG